MKIFEIKRPHKICFSFNSHDSDEFWSISVENKLKEKPIADFCINLCMEAKIRDADNFTENFSEQEFALLIKYFKMNDFIIDRRDTDLEEALKKTIQLSNDPSKKALLESIDYLSFNQQLELAETLNTIFK
jgi:hypothetical protein